MRNVLTLLLVIFVFVCCENSGYSEKAYTKVRVKRISVVKKNISKVKTIPKKGGSLSLSKVKKHFHIIVASSTNKSTANKLARSYKNKGYAINIMKCNARYRISLGDFVTKEQADVKKKELSLSLKKNDLWILKD